MPKLPSRENSVLKMRGAGDGLKTSMKSTPVPPLKISRTSDRVPVPSSRKFTATLAPRDVSMQLKLKSALDDLQGKPGTLKKSKSVAEITPTKSKLKNKLSNNDDSMIMLHATPRPHLVGDVSPTPEARREELKRRFAGILYERMLLNAWRRSKERVSILSESLRRRQDQVINLEKQVDCLKDLNQSECDKRSTAINDYQKLENQFSGLKMEKENLFAKLVELKGEAEKHADDVKRLAELSGEIFGKNKMIAELERQVYDGKEVIRKLTQDQVGSTSKINLQEHELQLKEKNVDNLKNAIHELNNELSKLQLLYDTKFYEYKQLMENYEREKCLNFDLKQGFEKRLDNIKKSMKIKLVQKERDMIDTTREYERVFRENKALKANAPGFKIVQKHVWNSAKDFVFVTWVVLQNAAYIMLPAL